MRNELSIDVSVNICVDEKTVRKCLRIIELHLEENKDKWIVARIAEDGSTRLEIESRGCANGPV